MWSLNPLLQGAWRIEESPKNSPWGRLKTHWVFVGHLVKVCSADDVHQADFKFRVRTDDDKNPREIILEDDVGFHGYYEVDRQLLFLSFLKGGGRPPRFASDCGDHFAFVRDNNFPIPNAPSFSRFSLSDSILGELNWQESSSVFSSWQGQARLTAEHTCPVLVEASLIPVERVLMLTRQVWEWTLLHRDDVLRACALSVLEWIEPDSEEDLSIEDWLNLDTSLEVDDSGWLSHESRDFVLSRIRETIQVTQLCGADHRVFLWAMTTLPIDHSLRVHFRIDRNKVLLDGVSIEG